MMKFLRTQMKWIMALIVVAFLLSTFLMYEGRGTRRTPGRNADGSMTDYEVAKINGRSLMRSELEQRLREYLSNYGTRSAESFDVATFYRAVLDTAVLEAQLAKEVEEKGIRVTDAEAEQAMKDYADRYYPTRETFYQALAQSGIKVDDYKRNLARQMAQDQLIRNAIGEVVISEDQATEFYDTMKTLIYSRPEGFMVHMSDFNEESAAEEFRTKLLNGESWDVIVSNDELASKDIINITKAPVFLPVSALQSGTLSIMASVDIGQPSEVFSVSSSDFAVGLKTEHVDETISPYDEVSADIKDLLTNQEQRRRLTEYQTSLINKAQLVINDEELFASPEVSEDVSDVNEVLPGLADEKPEVVAEEDTKPEPEAEASEEPAPEAPQTEEVEAETSETETPTAEPEANEETGTEEVEAVTPEAEATAPAEPQAKAEVPSTEEVETETSETEAPATEAEASEEPEPQEVESVTPEKATPTAEPEANEETGTEAPATEEVEAVTLAAEVAETTETTEEVITKSEDIPLQEEVIQAIDEDKEEK